MKKITVLLFIAAFGIALMSSCKTTNCPAYSEVDSVEVEQTA